MTTRHDEDTTGATGDAEPSDAGSCFSVPVRSTQPCSTGATAGGHRGQQWRHERRCSTRGLGHSRRFPVTSTGKHSPPSASLQLKNDSLRRRKHPTQAITTHPCWQVTCQGQEVSHARPHPDPAGVTLWHRPRTRYRVSHAHAIRHIPTAFSSVHPLTAALSHCTHISHTLPLQHTQVEGALTPASLIRPGSVAYNTCPCRSARYSSHAGNSTAARCPPSWAAHTSPPSFSAVSFGQGLRG